MVRQEIDKRPKAAGKQIKQLELFEDEEDFGKYRYSCFVTDLDLPAKIVYDSYRGRADSENRINPNPNDRFGINNLGECQRFLTFPQIYITIRSVLFIHVLECEQ